jgi:F-type H+-transporting ATPase subunit delta
MSNYRVAVRYANSLIGLAIETKKLEKVRSDIEMLDQLCKELRPFKNFLKNPIIHSYKKWGILKKLFESKVDDLTFKFLEIVTRKTRENILPEIAEQFLIEYRVYKKIQRVNIITPVALDEGLKKEFISIAKKYIGSDKTIELIENKDEEIVGGYIMRIGDKQIDESISAKLRDLRKKLIVS